MTSLEGAILAGGESRRMGRDKALLPIHGRPMLERIAASLSPLVERLRLIGAPEATAEEVALPVEPDRMPGLGPLSGIHAALATAEAEAVLVVACDLPFLTTAVLAEIARSLTAEAEAAVPRGPAGPVPVCAVYRKRCLRPLEAYLASGARSARGFVETLRVAWVEPDALARLDESGRALLNVNTPADYEDAVSLAEAEGSA